MSKLILIRLPDVLARLSISRSGLYAKIKEGTWPKPVKIGLRASAWLANESDQVIAALVAGKTESEIKQLVLNLHRSRNQQTGEGR